MTSVAGKAMANGCVRRISKSRLATMRSGLRLSQAFMRGTAEGAKTSAGSSCTREGLSALSTPIFAFRLTMPFSWFRVFIRAA